MEIKPEGPVTHPGTTFLDSGLRRNDDSEVFNCRSNITPFLYGVVIYALYPVPTDT